MQIKEFIEREFFINKDGKIFDNSLNENLEDNFLNENEDIIKEIYKKQSKEIKEVLKEHK